MEEILFEDIKKGEIIEVKTNNSTYILQSLENNNFMIQGGKYFPEPEERHINGCTFGGSMIWIGGIRVGMYLEICWKDNRRLVTSQIKKIKRRKKK